MNDLLELATIKIDLKMKGDFLAQVTLNWQDVFEVRFCRLMLRSNKSVWFQPPALRDFGWAKCFAVLDHDNWKQLEQKVTNIFIEELKKQIAGGIIAPEILEKIREHQQEEVNPEEIPI